MSRETELIEEIDEHIKEAGGIYGLELPDSDLRIIQKNLVQASVSIRVVPKEFKSGIVLDSCPVCGTPARLYRINKEPVLPNFCPRCGQKLEYPEIQE